MHFGQTCKAALKKMGDELTDARARMAKEIFSNAKSDFMRTLILKDRVRIDGRDLTTIRPLGSPERVSSLGHTARRSSLEVKPRHL